MTNLDSYIKNQRHYFDNKCLSSQGYGFPSGHVWMWELDYKESWVPNNWYFWTVVLEKTLESPLDSKEIQPVHPKGDQSWVFIGRTDAKAETPMFWPPDSKNWLIGEDPDAGENWGQEEKGTTEDKIVGWHHRLNGHGFGWTLGVGDGQGSLVCCSPWICKELDMTERMNWTELRQWGLYQANTLTNMCLHLKRVVRNFIVMLQKGCDQFVDILLIGWLLGKWSVYIIVNIHWNGGQHHELSDSKVWGLCACR